MKLKNNDKRLHVQAAQLNRRYMEGLISTLKSRGYGEGAVEYSLEALEELPYTPVGLATIVREAVRFLDDEFMGQANTPCVPGSRALISELVVASSSLREALQRCYRFYQLITRDFHYQLTEIDGVAEIEILFSGTGVDPQHLLKEILPIIWHRFAMWLIDEPLELQRVQFSHMPAVDIDQYQGLFGCECEFGRDSVVLSFDAAYLDKKIRRSADDVPDYFSHYAIDFCQLPVARKGLRDDIKRSMSDYFEVEQKFPTIEEMAQRHFMCSQTLRRRLKAEHTSYRQLKEEIRRERVVKYLANADISISEVSRMGGFAEPNGLTRAVKSWFGVCPKDYRSQIGVCR